MKNTSRKQVVVIVCHEDRQQWYKLQLQKSDYFGLNTLFYFNSKPSGYELSGLRRAYNDGYDDIILIQDSTLVKDSNILHKAFSMDGSVSFTKKYENYLGKYQKEIIDLVGGVPYISTKKEAVEHENTGFNKEYIAKAGKVVVLCPELCDNASREDIFGETRMVIENQYFKKYKGCWSPSMIKEE